MYLPINPNYDNTSSTELYLKISSDESQLNKVTETAGANISMTANLILKMQENSSS